MTQEEKELLIKDLSERLLFDIKIKIGEYSDYKLIGIVITDEHPIKLEVIENGIPYKIEVSPDIIKPYLRPMSSMTEEEQREYNLTKSLSIVDYMTLQSYNWLNKNKFDYRGLIEKGLALEAPEGMYNIKEK